MAKQATFTPAGRKLPGQAVLGRPRINPIGARTQLVALLPSEAFLKLKRHAASKGLPMTKIVERMIESLEDV